MSKIIQEKFVYVCVYPSRKAANDNFPITKDELETVLFSLRNEHSELCMSLIDMIADTSASEHEGLYLAIDTFEKLRDAMRILSLAFGEAIILKYFNNYGDELDMKEVAEYLTD